MLYRIATAFTTTQKKYLFLLIDAVMMILAMGGAMVLNAQIDVDLATLITAAPEFGGMLAATVALSLYIGLPQIRLNAYEMRCVAMSGVLSGSVALAGAMINGLVAPHIPTEVFFIFALLFLVLIAGWRVTLRHVVMKIYRLRQSRMRVLIYGAGQMGHQLVAALRTDRAIEPVAFVDDNPTLQSLRVAGLVVHSPANLKELIAKRRIDRVVLAMPSINQSRQARIAYSLREIGCEVHALPSFAEMVGEGDLRKRVLPVSLNDLLGRNRLESELPGVSDAYRGRRVLITGAGGSIGSELCQHLIACNPERIVLLDHSELALYNIDKELRELRTNIDIVPILASVTDDAKIRKVLASHNIDVVLHAAAYKHLPLVESNAIVGLHNNVIGTKIIADAARDAGVERFILVSSDKAVRPTNVMGASKRLAELVIQDLATRSSGTRFSMVRFGNVLGSSGSVVPLFEEQIARGGPVTLTHSAVTRYFMTISEAARLVLLAGSFARGGDVFVLDMGAPVPIARLARQMIEGAGYCVKDDETPDGDIEIQISGLRQGEKLHEELLISSDMLTTPHAKILRAQESFLSEIEMASALKDLSRAISRLDEEGAKAVIARWVERGIDMPQAEDVAL
ncbi:nucleoside-diphosphate sugar epimerase/dehydratase [Puniceibacterium sediminis]|uniref:polysaccharide biosynthesis protein n=1 Tax=Puniceibacterium sediminis TaxID=1608407 RepID=UPI000B78112E|nr:nucleoside-diphosphate sugar epimerase/dehydratase [Puniceibacterium sediminis]